MVLMESPTTYRSADCESTYPVSMTTMSSSTSALQSVRMNPTVNFKHGVSPSSDTTRTSSVAETSPRQEYMEICNKHGAGGGGDYVEFHD